MAVHSPEYDDFPQLARRHSFMPTKKPKKPNMAVHSPEYDDFPHLPELADGNCKISLFGALPT